jgi:osmotically-inducible protein OsmY
MVKVDGTTTDCAIAWRVRDALAAHPLLGGATAQIHVIVNRQAIVLDGWALNEHVVQLAARLACRVAGQRTVQLRLQNRSLPRHRQGGTALTASKR